MNLVIVDDGDFHDPSAVRLSGRRFEHIRDILRLKVGDKLSVGRLGGLIGEGTITALAVNTVDLFVKFKQKPPAPLNMTLIMALPRPPMLKRTLQCVAALGVKDIIILNCAKVEKSLWQSSALVPDAVHGELRLGLEQAKDTILPRVTLEKKFKPFVEDKLSTLIKNKAAFVAHPGEKGKLSKIGRKPVVLLIGPEGGFTDFEVGLLKSKGVQGVGLGERILRFEHVIPYVIGRLTK